MWRDEKTEYLRRNRDYGSLLESDDAEAQTPQAQNGGRSKDRQLAAEDDDGGPERQEYLNRRQRLKELERQKLTKGKNGVYASDSRNEVPKAGQQNKNNGVSRSGGDLSLSKEKKKLPYDRSFGSFFGPSEPVVAKRVIEEARAREEAEIVAARNAKASREAERKKAVASLSARKITLDRKPPRPKPVDKTTEKARKLKEARDYSFLFDDSPLPGPNVVAREGAAPSKLGVEKHGPASVQANSHPPRKISSEQLKHTLGSRVSDGSTKSSRPLQSQSKPIQPSRSLPRQGSQDHHPFDRSAIQSSSAKQFASKVSSAGPGRPDPWKGEDSRNEAMLTELVSGSVASNGKKSTPQIVDRNQTERAARPPSRQADRPLSRPTSAQAEDRLRSRATSSQAADRLSSRSTSAQAADRLPSRATSSQAADRLPSRATSAQAADRLPSRATSSQAADRLPSRATSAHAADRPPSRATSAQAADRQPSRATSAQASDRLPSRVTSAQASDKLPSRAASAQAADRRPTQPAGRLAPPVKDTGMARSSERGPAMSQGLKKGAPNSASYRAGPVREEPRRQVSASQKPSLKAASRPALSNNTRGAKYPEDSWRSETRPRKRARSSSEESDERPRSRNKLPSIGVNGIRSIAQRARSSSEEDDDSFIDDDDDPGNVSSMIHSIMGYNPNKYRGNDDFDDRTMEVGFHHIQAEERRSAREARLEDERELALIEAEEKAERLRKAKRKRN